MWNRKELKTRGKAAFKANYWPCVLVAFIMMAIVGGGLAATRNSAQSSAENQREELSASLAEATGNDTFTITEDGQWLVEIDGELVDVTETEEFQIIILPAIVIGVAAVLFVAWLFGTIADIFLINPIEVSCLYFFTRNATGEARISDLKRGFTPGYLSNVKTLFLRDLFLYLWALLLIIPGIVKAYSYRMVPYIAAEHPEMGAKEVITLSRKMMDGQKLNAFLLDLSFIGWHLLGFLTFGLLEAFYVAPYRAATCAELYRTLAAAQPELANN